MFWVRRGSSEYLRSSGRWLPAPDTPTAKPTQRPSGEKNGPSADSLSGTGVAAAAPSTRMYNCDGLATLLATNASVPPSGERATTGGLAPARNVPGGRGIEGGRG